MKIEKILIGVVFIFVLLSVVLANAEIIWDETGGIFTITIDYPVCDDSGNFFTDYTTDPPSLLPTIGDSPPADCYNPDAEEGDQMCCPTGAECRSTTQITPAGKVIWNCFTTGIDFCWDYTDLDSCNNDTARVGEETVGWLFNIEEGDELAWWVNATSLENCVDVARDFGCYWNGSYCQPEYNNETICEGDDDFQEPNDFCVVENLEQTDNCNTTGFLAVRWEASWDTSGEQTPDCSSGNTLIPCSDITKLIFFTWISIIAVIVILIVVYYWYIVYKKKEKKKKKR